jgi:tripartite-type tricarboxylate transporter receptor subunit TctC
LDVQEEMKMAIRILAMIWIAALAVSNAVAADYPERPIRLVVASSVGGGLDFVARIVAPRVGAKLGQPVVVDNRGGAAGLVGSELVAKAAPDGYTLLLVFANFATFPSLEKKLSFDPMKDLLPVANLATSPLVLVVPPSLHVTSVANVVALAKRDKTLNFASPGVGSMGHLAAELFQSMAGVKMTHIPYKGGGPAIAALLGGQVQMYFSTPPAALAQIKAGKLIGVGVTGRTRAAFAPDIPTIAESGLPGYDVNGWVGLFAPAGTPKPVIDAVSAAFDDAVKDAAVQESFSKEGVTAVGNSPAEFAQEVQADVAKWKKVIQTAHISLD